MDLAPATNAGESAKAAARLEWVDVAKGVGIVLVILGHVPPLEGQEVHRVIYWFHMPLFFFLGGVVLRRTVPTKDMIARRARQLAIPYFVYLTILETPYYVEFVANPARRPQIAAGI